MDISSLPDDALVPMRFVREYFVPKANAELRDMTTQELSAEFGHSADWWQDRCRQGKIHGAYQDGSRSKWYIPREHAKVFLRELQEARRERRARHRKPWKGPQAA